MTGPPFRARTQNFAQYLKPIETPLVFNGFSEDAVRQFAPQFAAAGIVPVMGAGSVSEGETARTAGGRIGGQRDPGARRHGYRCHLHRDLHRSSAICWPADIRLLQFGSVDLPMNKAQVLATLPSPLNAFKIVNTTERAGAFVQDRHTGILGVFNKQPDMIPVTLTIHGGAVRKEFHYEVLNNPRLSPVAIMATVFNALHGVNEYGEEITYRLNGRLM